MALVPLHQPPHRHTHHSPPPPPLLQAPPENRTPHILRQRNVISGCLLAFFLTGTLSIHVYYLPIYFQVIVNSSATHSGTNLTQYLLSNVLFTIIAGGLVTRLGNYNAPAPIGPLLNVACCALLTTLEVDTSTPSSIGYQILTAAGSGMAIQ